MLTLTWCQDHILAENIWFVCSETSYSGDVTDAGQTTNEEEEELNIELLSQWKLEAESRNIQFRHQKMGKAIGICYAIDRKKILKDLNIEINIAMEAGGWVLQNSEEDEKIKTI